ncbi:ketopantoate reductase family protein [Pukyongiella litopenaei]|uniref:2-dehydropantoate 2-reductase n=1 Tax=Pukyongiella litopenaei TaxID=2605946 RepID=A0A2S0MR99_9RHOB|nr:2-dehydropantoate 2-reductase N-terminal domain-containing protein [Pukyongiella litopenaei]AVO38357.1 ketopantoate reductase family protein [Pukyongiella litopenaei]
MSEPLLIWGAGAIGGILGAYLARAGHAVHMVDIVEDHVNAMRSNGLHIEGPVETFTQVLPASTPSELKGQFSRVILAVKAHHTEAALDMLMPHLAPGGYVVSAQNGLNEIVISERIGAQNTVGCFVNYGADWLEPGRILYGNRAAVAVGELAGPVIDRTRDVHRLLCIVEPEAVLTDNIWGYLWGKLGYGALLFATALTPLSMSEAMAHPSHRPVYRELGHEVMCLANAQGIRPLGFNGFDPDAFLAADREGMDASLAAMIEHNRHTAKTHSGIWRDLAVRKRRTEVDAQVGLLVELGHQLGLKVSTLSRLVELIHDIEEGRRTQSVELVDLMVPTCS